MRRKRKSREQWAALVAELEQRQVSLAEFARQHRVSVSSLLRWRSLLGWTSRTASLVPEVDFVEVVPPEAMSLNPASVAWIELGSAAVLRFSRLPEPSYLAQLARALGA